MGNGSTHETTDLPTPTQALLDAVVAIGSDLDSRSVLDRMVEAACRLTSARYGALGVIGSSGTLVDFVTHGLTRQQVEDIGPLPEGEDILGLLIDEPRPSEQSPLTRRGDRPRDELRSTKNTLVIPIRIRGTVFGNLYLTEKPAGSEFTKQDEMLVEALATAAGFVIDNARTYAQSERRRMWLEATAQVIDALQPPVRLHEALQQIAISARRVSGAAAVAVVQREPDGHEITAWDGQPAADLPSFVHDLREHIDRAVAEPDVVIVPRKGKSTVILASLSAQVAANGVLLVVPGKDRPPLETEEVELLVSFADQASFALDRAQAISDRAELAIVSDRDRIARDLHDLVIQRLFATGLQLQGAQRGTISDSVRHRLASAVSDLDLTIRDIRTTIFELQNAHRFSVRVDVRVLTEEYAPLLGFTPTVRTSGPVDTAIAPELGEQLRAVLREALSNVARHAQATGAVVDVEVVEKDVLLRVSDDGRGMPDETHESGLRNVRGRASEHGGSLRIYPREPLGTVLEWQVPLT